MRTIHKILLFASFVILIIFFSTCKKYPDGGYTNRARKNILKHKGNWSLMRYEVNGIDSTDFINPANYNDYKKNFIQFMKSQSSETTFYGTNFRIGYTLYFTGEYSELVFTGGGDNGLVSYGTCGSSSIYDCQRPIFMPEGESTAWSINKFTKKEIELKYSLKNSYIIKLKCND